MTEILANISIYDKMIKSAKIYIFSTYMEFLQDLCPTGAKTNKVTGRFWQNQVLDPNNISLY